MSVSVNSPSLLWPKWQPPTFRDLGFFFQKSLIFCDRADPAAAKKCYVLATIAPD
jgi:hypothetical protein